MYVVNVRHVSIVLDTLKLLFLLNAFFYCKKKKAIPVIYFFIISLITYALSSDLDNKWQVLWLFLHCDTVRLERILYKAAHLPLFSSVGTLPSSFIVVI